MKCLEKKNRWELHKDATCCFEQILGAAQNNSCMATYFPSHKLSRLNKQDMLGSAGEVRIKS